LLCSSEVSSDKAAAATVGVSALSIAKTTLAADPLASLAKQLGGSKRNALLRWCQNRTATYTVYTVVSSSSTISYFLLLTYCTKMTFDRKCTVSANLKCSYGTDTFGLEPAFSRVAPYEAKFPKKVFQKETF